VFSALVALKMSAASHSENVEVSGDGSLQHENVPASVAWRKEMASAEKKTLAAWRAGKYRPAVAGDARRHLASAEK